ncbi:hypothetical protein Pla123a_48300 [Posidoniimonas polymericola]|uniref:HEAT repeat domain-containing protein n=1 Tax=Posidoniimonas polymericola TaxID=2528002 RepID=A0A5C5XTM0_9BACT|nr:hypothetical protein [Posidoniimonas polymericola]TWT65919.1 hypothetical protein Pla123a_48300 [Posidoniimonas polymericola]
MRRIAIFLLTLSLLTGPTARVFACPFCSAEQSTLTEELGTADAAVIARLVREASSVMDAGNGPLDPDAGKAGFRVEDVLFGEGIEPGKTEFDAIYFGESDKEAAYLIRGIGEPYEWAIPLKLSDRAVDYVKQLRSLPESGPGRIAFFQDFLQDEDPMLAQDAYDEFARAPYSDVRGIKDQMDRQQLLAWIEDPAVSPSRRRLFLTMLGVCGTEEDLPRLESMLTSDSRRLIPAAEAAAAASFAAGAPLGSTLTIEAIRLNERAKKQGLDALIACYLTLRGPDGLDLIDQRFLSGEKVNGMAADYSHIYSALMALRFLAEESDIVPMDRLVTSARLLLDNPDFADQVIPDLARWEDWSVLERLTDMYARAGEEDSGVQKYVREPIITYLDVAAEQEGEVADRAAAALEEIEGVDPAAVKRARSLRAFGFLAQARPKASTTADARQPTGLSNVGDDPVVLAEDEATDEPPAEMESADNNLPDPSAFATPQGSRMANPRPSDTDELQGVMPGPAADEQKAAEGESVADAPAANPEDPKPAAANSVATLDPAPEPPSRTLLIAAPTAAGVLCFGLFWMILRSGES